MLLSSFGEQNFININTRDLIKSFKHIQRKQKVTIYEKNQTKKKSTIMKQWKLVFFSVLFFIISVFNLSFQVLILVSVVILKDVIFETSSNTICPHIFVYSICNIVSSFLMMIMVVTSFVSYTVWKFRHDYFLSLLVLYTLGCVVYGLTAYILGLLNCRNANYPFWFTLIILGINLCILLLTVTIGTRFSSYLRSSYKERVNEISTYCQCDYENGDKDSYYYNDTNTEKWGSSYYENDVNPKLVNPKLVNPKTITMQERPSWESDYVDEYDLYKDRVNQENVYYEKSRK